MPGNKDFAGQGQGQIICWLTMHHGNTEQIFSARETWGEVLVDRKGEAGFMKEASKQF